MLLSLPDELFTHVCLFLWPREVVGLRRVARGVSTALVRRAVEERLWRSVGRLGRSCPNLLQFCIIGEDVVRRACSAVSQTAFMFRGVYGLVAYEKGEYEVRALVRGHGVAHIELGAGKSKRRLNILLTPATAHVAGWPVVRRPDAEAGCDPLSVWIAYLIATPGPEPGDALCPRMPHHSESTRTLVRAELTVDVYTPSDVLCVTRAPGMAVDLVVVIPKSCARPVDVGAMSALLASGETRIAVRDL